MQRMKVQVVSDPKMAKARSVNGKDDLTCGPKTWWFHLEPYPFVCIVLLVCGETVVCFSRGGGEIGERRGGLRQVVSNHGCNSATSMARFKPPQ